MATKKIFKMGSRFFIILVCMGMGLLLIPQSAYAFPPSERRDGVRHPPHRGKGFERSAPRHRVIWTGKKRYPLHDRFYHRRAPSAFIAVGIPLGKVFLNLPIGFETVVSCGTTYYRCGGVYYKRVPSGYMVVQEPFCEDVPEFRPQRISVTADNLYVRKGPGKNYTVMARVSYGVVLPVRGHAPGWLYVELPNKSLGWVMSKYTAPLAASPKG